MKPIINCDCGERATTYYASVPVCQTCQDMLLKRHPRKGNTIQVFSGRRRKRVWDETDGLSQAVAKGYDHFLKTHNLEHLRFKG